MKYDPMIAAVLAGHGHWAVAVQPRWEENLTESRARLFDHVEKSLQDARFSNLTFAAPGNYCFVMEELMVLIYPDGDHQLCVHDRYLLPVCDFSTHVAKVNGATTYPLHIN